MNATVVVIPTFNEAANIQGILRAVVDLPAAFDVLVVDDNSPDGTADLVRELRATFPQLHLEVRQNKDGLGPAYIHAFKWAMDMLALRTNPKTFFTTISSGDMLSFR